MFEETLQGQMNIFDFLTDSNTNGKPKPLKIKNKVRLIEAFGGIGSQAMALERLGVEFESKLIEYDKYPVASYNAIHGTNFEPTDITKIHGADLGITDVEHFTYLLTYSFPCQDLSIAGKQRGMTKGSGTRSGLLWEVERLLNECGNNLPQILLMENVPQVHSKANMPDFQEWLNFLESKGYTNVYKDLNAKNYGVAQNRNRCFCVSFLGNYRYEFPAEIPLTKVMKDYLEDNVDKKYYITSEKAKMLIDKLILDGKILTDRQIDRQSTCQLTSRELSKEQTVSRQDMTQESAICQQTEAECVKQLGYIERGTGKHQSNTVYSSDGIAPTLASVNYKDPVKVVECHKL